ncbi:FMN-dependent dehydrogenase [Aliiruegeria haliotis]|uniref:FMN-dependent dehydrogenase n=1 Tax=Aliiruegeria haliotis TaxID=1280846 RepID=A0A2T0RF45_9RHOB|nr:alpha-hydroxy acid oxidase [Aliiruegeria haliotis]PRY19762.1 FMN-dependent dehydrogenase [Aliiruegeria haliotis]
MTVDLVRKRVLETRNILRRTDTRDCKQCHGATTVEERVRFMPMYRDFDLSGVSNPMDPAMTWDSLERLREKTSMKVVVKGLMTPEDAAIEEGRGFDGMAVSNHGGRADESGFASIDAHPAITEQVDGAIPVIVDSGFRRGSDIVKALCMGADMVCVGRPYIWGLTAFGQAGVERVMQLLDAELQVTMQQMGVSRPADLTKDMIGTV